MSKPEVYTPADIDEAMMVLGAELDSLTEQQLKDQAQDKLDELELRLEKLLSKNGSNEPTEEILVLEAQIRGLIGIVEHGFAAIAEG